MVKRCDNGKVDRAHGYNLKIFVVPKQIEYSHKASGITCADTGLLKIIPILMEALMKIVVERAKMKCSMKTKFHTKCY